MATLTAQPQTTGSQLHQHLTDMQEYEYDDRPGSPLSCSSFIEGDIEMDRDHADFYYQQQQQALLYQQHHQQHGLEPGAARMTARHARMNADGDSDDGFSDEESDSDSMPDESIDFSLTYAL